MSQLVKLSLEQEFERNPELKESDIESLREWCNKEPHLPKITDSTLALFLHKNYYRIEPTKINIEQYYTLRTHLPEFFANRDPVNCKATRDIFEALCITPLKELTKDGHNILLVKVIDEDPSKFNFLSYVKYMFLVVDLWIYRSGAENGYSVVFDIQDVTLRHAAKISLFMMKKYMVYVNEGVPVRVKGLHFVYINPGMEAILNISRPLMSKELLDNLHLHTSLKTLEKFLNVDALPNEVGGKGGSVKKLHEAQIKELEENRNWFLEEEARSKVDESQRIGTQKSAEMFFGVEGNYKNISED